MVKSRHLHSLFSLKKVSVKSTFNGIHLFSKHNTSERNRLLIRRKCRLGLLSIGNWLDHCWEGFLTGTWRMKVRFTHTSILMHLNSNVSLYILNKSAVNGLETNLASWPAYFDSKYHVIVLKNLFSITLHGDLSPWMWTTKRITTRITAGYECDSLKGQQLEANFTIQQ